MALALVAVTTEETIASALRAGCELAEAILIAHQRHDVRSCLCGWAELGRSHARHQVAMLREAGVLAGGGT